MGLDSVSVKKTSTQQVVARVIITWMNPSLIQSPTVYVIDQSQLAEIYRDKSIISCPLWFISPL